MKNKYKGKILELIREKNSTNGNPRFTAIIQGTNGFVTMATTSPDSSLGYSIRNYDGHWIEYETKDIRGRLTLVSLEPLNRDETGRYIESEFSALPDSPVYLLQVRGCSDQGETGKTKWVNVTGSQLQRIREILVYG